jgi:hypothetical protein
MTNANTAKLQELGQSIWLDNITRDLLTSGTLARYIDELHVTGLTAPGRKRAAGRVLAGYAPSYAGLIFISRRQAAKRDRRPICWGSAEHTIIDRLSGRGRRVCGSATSN